MKADDLQKNTGLNANILKLIAVIAMVVQHATIVFYPTENALHWTLYAVGRITAPVMCFMIVRILSHIKYQKVFDAFVCSNLDLTYTSCTGIWIFTI